MTAGARLMRDTGIREAGTMPPGLASPGPLPKGRGFLRGRRSPPGSGPFLAATAAAALAAASLASGNEPIREVCHALPAVLAAVSARLGARAAASAAGGALAALAIDMSRRGISASDALALASVGAASAVVIGCVSLRWFRKSPEPVPGDDETAALRLALEETDHRIRNDLAALQSAASILSAGLEGEEGRTALSCLSGRIRILGCVHRRLGHGPSGNGDVEMRHFMEELCAELRAAHLGLRPVRLSVHSGDLTLPRSSAVTVGLLVNEALTNAMKHAFPGGREGRVWVRLVEDAIVPEMLVLTVTDDGIGLVNASRAGRGEGSRLVDAMAGRLGGTATWELLDGMTVLRVRFPAGSGGQA